MERVAEVVARAPEVVGRKRTKCRGQSVGHRFIGRGAMKTGGRNATVERLNSLGQGDRTVIGDLQAAQGFVNALGMLENGGRPRMTPQTRSR